MGLSRLRANIHHYLCYNMVMEMFEGCLNAKERQVARERHEVVEVIVKRESARDAEIERKKNETNELNT